MHVHCYVRRLILIACVDLSRVTIIFPHTKCVCTWFTSVITILLPFFLFNRPINNPCILFLLDINECLNSSCHFNATCMNIDGSYTCTCISGYSGNGSVCTGMYGICLSIICILTMEPMPFIDISRYI